MGGVKLLAKGIGLNAAIVASGRVLGMVSIFLFNALLARTISQDQMGYYFLVLSIVTFFAIPARVGCENVSMKIVSDAINSGENRRLWGFLGAIGKLFLCSGSLVFLVCLFIFPLVFQYIFKADIIVGLVPWLCVWVILYAGQLLFGQILRAFKSFLGCSLLGGTLSSLMNFLVLLGANLLVDVNLYSVVVLVVVNLFVVNLVAIFVVFKVAKRNASKYFHSDFFQGERMGKLLLLSAPICISQIALFVSSQSDVFLLAAYLSPEQVALYGAAAKLVLFTGVALAIANGVLPPYISEYRSRADMRGLQFLLRRIATLASLPAVALLALFLLMPKLVMGWVYGESYSAAAELLRILAVGQLVNVLVGSCGYVLIMFGFNKLIMKLTLLFGSIVILGGFLILEFGYGVIEMAILVTVVMSLQQLTMLYLVKKNCGIYTAVKYA